MLRSHSASIANIHHVLQCRDRKFANEVDEAFLDSAKIKFIYQLSQNIQEQLLTTGISDFVL